MGSLPKALTNHFQVLILVDTAFGSIEFLTGIRQLKYHAIAGVRCDRKLDNGRSIAHLHKRGQQVRLVGLKFPVSLSWYYLKRDDGKKEKRYVLSTKVLKGHTMTLLILLLLLEIRRLQPLVQAQGLEIQVIRCKM